MRSSAGKQVDIYARAVCGRGCALAGHRRSVPLQIWERSLTEQRTNSYNPAAGQMGVAYYAAPNIDSTTLNVQF